jgi:hypothetical protein
VLLNLTYWVSDVGGGDILVDTRIAADVVAHVAWHHLASKHLGSPAHPRPSADALALGEAIASAFDVYLLGRLLGHARRSSFLTTQVPAMSESAAQAGLSKRAFEKLLQGIADDPERAFEDLRQLLVDVTRALVACDNASAALAVLHDVEGHRFAPLLHHYELSNWTLYARAYAAAALAPDLHVRAIDATLREAPSSLAWLEENWVRPALQGEPWTSR